MEILTKTNICQNCLSSYIPKNSKQRFCSIDCRRFKTLLDDRTLTQQKFASLPKVFCSECKTSIKPERIVRGATVCSRACSIKRDGRVRRESGRLRKANMPPEKAKAIQEAKNQWRKNNLKEITCPVCHKKAYKDPGKKQATCSLRCGGLSRRGIVLSESKEIVLVSKPTRKTTAPTTVLQGRWFTAGNCAVCMESFVSHSSDKTCSPKCRKKHRKSGTGHKRFQISPSKRFAIYRRDKYICQICGVPVPQKLDYSHDQWNPLFPSLDHITPQSLQDKPDHTENNLRLAHVICNSYRNNDIDWVPSEDLVSQLSNLYSEQI